MPSVNVVACKRDSRTDDTMLIDVGSLSLLNQTETSPDEPKYGSPSPKTDADPALEKPVKVSPRSLLLPKSAAPPKVHQRQVSLPCPRSLSSPPLQNSPSSERSLSHHRRASSSSSAGTSLFLSMAHDDEAIEELWENLRKRRRVLGRSHPKVGLHYNHIGNCHFRRGEMDAALSAYTEALKVYEQYCQNLQDEAETNPEQSASSLRSLGSLGSSGSDTSTEPVSFPIIALCLCNIGTVQWRTGNISRAVESLEESVRIYCRYCAAADQSPMDSPELSTAWYNLGLAYCLRSDYGEALEAFDMARKGFTSCRGVDSVEVARVMDSVGKVSLLRGDSKKALACHRMALRMKMSALGHSHPSVLCSMMSVAAAQRARSELLDARSMYFEVLRVQKSILSHARQVSGNGSWSRSVVCDVAQTLHFLGLVNEELGDSKHAIKCYDEGLEAYTESELSKDDDRVVLLRERVSAQRQKEKENTPSAI